MARVAPIPVNHHLEITLTPPDVDERLANRRTALDAAVAFVNRATLVGVLDVANTFIEWLER